MSEYKVEMPFTFHVRKEYYLVKPWLAMYHSAIFEDKRDAERFAANVLGTVETILIHPKGSLRWKEGTK